MISRWTFNRSLVLWYPEANLLLDDDSKCLLGNGWTSPNIDLKLVGFRVPGRFYHFFWVKA